MIERLVRKALKLLMHQKGVKRLARWEYRAWGYLTVKMLSINLFLVAVGFFINVGNPDSNGTIHTLLSLLYVLSLIGCIGGMWGLTYTLIHRYLPYKL